MCSPSYTSRPATYAGGEAGGWWWRTSAPRSRRSKCYRATRARAGTRVEGLIDELRAEALEIRHRYGADTEMCRRELIEAGMRCARASGWNDTYTLTKWLGEQLLLQKRDQVPLVVFRPAIIEGSYDEPAPGWIDGLRMADPLFVAYGRGKLDEFPAGPGDRARPDPGGLRRQRDAGHLCRWGSGASSEVRLYHCASSGRNPVRLGDMIGYNGGGVPQASDERRAGSADQALADHLL